MNEEIGADAVQFPEKEYINGIAFAVQDGYWYMYIVKTRKVLKAFLNNRRHMYDQFDHRPWSMVIQETYTYTGMEQGQSHCTKILNILFFRVNAQLRSLFSVMHAAK
jgi:hypothetical protein